MSKKQLQNILPVLLAGIVLGVCITLLLPKLKTIQFSKSSVEKELADQSNEPEIQEEYEYGLRVDTFKMMKSEVLKNQFVSEILASFKVDNQTVHNLAMNAADIFDFRQFRAGNSYTILADKNTSDTVAKYLVYEKNPIEYIVYNLQDPSDIQLRERPTTKKQNVVEGTINGSLWNNLKDSGADPELAVKLSQVYQWTIDFTRLNAGDQYKVVYDEIYVDGKYYRTDSISAAFFEHNGKDYYAFYFDQGEDKQAGFYDENGESLKRAFLRAPVKYSRISSRYSGRRFHPVQKRYKAHLGTDYAAPHGTPIYATADGNVIAASYTRGNGNYVKIKHNDTYTTQYLHMTKRAVRNGQRVSQGEVIGYVGSTGLATGPHVCYRFWKNGRQVDHLRLDLPSGDPIAEDKMQEFETVKAKLLKELDYPADTIEPMNKDNEGFEVASFLTE